MIRGEKVNLRAVERSDAAFYHQWVNDETSNETRGLYLPTSMVEAQSWVDARLVPTPEGLTLAIEAEGEGHIGFVSLRGICTRSRRAEISIYIGKPDQWGKGFGKDALRTLCNYGFQSMNLFRIWLECDAEYEKIVRAYESVGFVLEGRLRKSYFRHGDYRDTLVMGLLKEEWSVRTSI